MEKKNVHSCELKKYTPQIKGDAEKWKKEGSTKVFDSYLLNPLHAYHISLSLENAPLVFQLSTFTDTVLLPNNTPQNSTKLPNNNQRVLKWMLFSCIKNAS